MTEAAGMRLGGIVALLALVGCRSDATGPSEPGSPPPVEPRRDAASEPPTSEPEAPHATEPEHAGPPISREQVVATFQRWWTPFSNAQLTSHPLRAQLDALAAAGGTPKQDACERLAGHVDERAPAGSPALLHGATARLREQDEPCWWLHHDGMMGPGLGAVLASDGRVLVVWIVSEG